MSPRIALFAVLAVAVGLLLLPARGDDPTKPAASGTEPGKGQPAADRDLQRLVNVVRHAPAESLAGALQQHFKGAASVQVVAEPTSNCLLITAAPATVKEIVTTLEQLDRRPRLIAVELLMVELGAGEDGKPAVEAKELSGPADKVLATIRDLRSQRKLTVLRQAQLTVAEGQKTTLRVGEMRAMITGVNVSPRGTGQNMIVYRDTGTMITVAGRASTDGAATLELSFEDSRLHTPADGAILGQDEKGQPIRAAETIVSQVRGTLRIPAGEAVLASGLQTTSRSPVTQTLLIVTARVAQ